MTPSPLGHVLSKFPDAKPQPDGEYKALCPAHNDNRPTLSIGPADNGGVLLHCFAGCDNAAIVAAVGLTLADLMPPGGKEKRPAEKWEEVKGSKKFVVAYSYTDENGELLCQSVRFTIRERNSVTGAERDAKTFSQRREVRPGESAKGQFVYSMKGVRYVLYGLPEVLKAVAEKRPVYIVEGEKDVQNIVGRLGFTATTNIGGAAAKWKPEYSETLRGAHVVLIPDNDTAGRKHMAEVAAALYPVAASVRVLELPGLPEKGDATNWIESGGTEAELFALSKAAPLWEQPEGTTESGEIIGDTVASNLPAILTTNREDRDISRDAWEAMNKANTPPVLFARETGLARLRRHADTGRIVIETLDTKRLLHRLRRVADFRAIRTKRDGTTSEVTVPAPVRLAEDMLADAERIAGMPPLRSIVYAPFVDAHGRMVAAPGYHRESRVYLDMQSDVSLSKTAPTVDDARAACARFFAPRTGVFGEFPYATDSDRAAAVACLLTPFLRPYIAANVPLALVEAPAQGTGKSTLARNLIAIADPFVRNQNAPTGRSAEDSEAEWSKVLGACLKDGPSTLFLDNIRGVLASQALESLLTSITPWETRLLGTSENVTVWPELLTIVGTSNNAEMNRDMARRSYVIRLDANMEQPETRTGFAIPDLDVYVKANRSPLLGDVLVILSAWIAQGRPEGKAVKGSFDRWARVLSGILDMLAVPGFLEAEAEGSVFLDPETARWTAFFFEWWRTHKRREVGSKELLECAVKAEIITDASHASAPRSLARQLTKFRDRVFGDYRLSQRVGGGGYMFYSLSKAQTEPESTPEPEKMPQNAPKAPLKSDLCDFSDSQTVATREKLQSNDNGIVNAYETIGEQSHQSHISHSAEDIDPDDDEIII